MSQNNESTVQNNTATVLSMIERVAMSKDVDIEKMEKLLDMQERIAMRNAETAFYSDFSEMQVDIPIIYEDGEISYTSKSGNNNATRYSTLENILTVVKPIMKKYGFSIFFKTSSTDKTITVIGTLAHRAGYKVETDITLPFDNSGAKNGVQAIGSSTSYGKRYVLCALLNIATSKEDDDGNSAMQKVDVTKYITRINNAKDQEELTKIWHLATTETKDKNDLAAHEEIKAYLVNRKKEIEASA